jgi:hypothetical protein
MTALADLHRSVQAVLTGNRLGSPVFVRYHLQSADKASAVPRRLAQVLAVVTGWLGRPIERVYAQGAPRSGQVSVLLEMRNGATAVISWAAGAVQGAGVDITVLGNHGALYHDVGTGQLWDEAAMALTDAPDPAHLEWIERALRSGRPETAERRPAP